MRPPILAAVVLIAGCSAAEAPPTPPPDRVAWKPGDRVVLGRLKGGDVPACDDRDDDWEALSGALADASPARLENLAAIQLVALVPGGEHGTITRVGPGYATVRLDAGPVARVPADVLSADSPEIPAGRLSPRCCFCGERPRLLPSAEGLVFEWHPAGRDTKVKCPSTWKPAAENSQPAAP